MSEVPLYRGPLQDIRRSLMGVRGGWAFSYERGTPVQDIRRSVRGRARAPRRRSRHTPLREEQLLSRDVKRFRGGLVFKTHRLVYHSILVLRVIIKKKKVAAHNPARCSVSAARGRWIYGYLEKGIQTPMAKAGLLKSSRR